MPYTNPKLYFRKLVILLCFALASVHWAFAVMEALHGHIIILRAGERPNDTKGA